MSELIRTSKTRGTHKVIAEGSGNVQKNTYSKTVIELCLADEKHHYIIRLSKEDAMKIAKHARDTWGTTEGRGV